MPLYAFVCRSYVAGSALRVEHEVLTLAPMHDAPSHAVCLEHATRCARDYSSVRQKSSDPIRDGWLSSKLEHNLAEQGRPLDPLAPKDRFEAKRVRERTGRVYFGDDDSQLSPAAHKAIAKGRRGEYEYQNGKPDLT